MPRVAGLLLVLLSALASMADDTRTNPDSVVATVNGEAITSVQVDAAARAQLAQLEERARQIRDATLNKLIDNLLLEQAARKSGSTTDEFLARQVESVTVSAAEVDQAYSRSRDQFGGALPAEAKYRIRRTLEDNARAAALQRLLADLRRDAKVTNHLVAGAAAALTAAAREGPALGPDTAPITILEFSDFECPYCRSAQPAVRSVMKRWPGKVRLVFKHFPLDQHPHAMSAAKAGVCAERQGRFWQLHDALFGEAGSPTLDVIRSEVRKIGLNMEEFERCIRSAEPEDHVRKDALLGRMAGVNGTPAFFVNGVLVPGATGLESAVERAIGGTR